MKSKEFYETNEEEALRRYPKGVFVECLVGSNRGYPVQVSHHRPPIYDEALKEVWIHTYSCSRNVCVMKAGKWAKRVRKPIKVPELNFLDKLKMRYRNFLCIFNIYHDFLYYKESYTFTTGYSTIKQPILTRRCCNCSLTQRKNMTPKYNGAQVGPKWINLTEN